MSQKPQPKVSHAKLVEVNSYTVIWNFTPLFWNQYLENLIILGIPEFWLTIFKNVDMLQEMVQEHDEPVLAALTDVKVTFSDGSSEANPMVNYSWTLLP